MRTGQGRAFSDESNDTKGRKQRFTLLARGLTVGTTALPILSAFLVAMVLLLNVAGDPLYRNKIDFN
jgi:hypothetical protein